MRQKRPAVVLTNERFNEAGRSVLAMITSTSEPWPADRPIEDLHAAGLKAQCKVRLKLFTLENQLIVKRIGSLASADRMTLSDGWTQFGFSLSTRS